MVFDREELSNSSTISFSPPERAGFKVNRMVEKTKDRVVFLDCMRIFAFATVLIGHKLYEKLQAVAQDQSLHESIQCIAKLMLPLCFGGGASGVIVFFLTSGYIITHVLNKEHTQEFIIKRIFRIYPLYIFAIIIEAALAKLIDGTALPDLSIFIPRILLIGDFFGTPLALAGVEWTLRVEILFYVYMATLRYFRILEKPKLAVIAFLATTIFIFYAPPFPAIAAFSNGYLSAMGPYLLMGACFYIYEHNKNIRNLCIMTGITITILSIVTISNRHKILMHDNYALLAVSIFCFGWLIRDRIQYGPIIGLVSSLTYAIYLFHKWMWEYIKRAVTEVGITAIPQDLQIFIILMAICYLAHISVEKYGLKIGRKVLNRYLDMRNNFSLKTP
ncbi:acyltransferase family protein [Pseudomonas mohnii]